MFLEFFLLLRNDKMPVGMQEYLTLLEALDKDVVEYNTEDFYFLSRAIFVKHEEHLDRFDQLFSHFFKGMELVPKELVFAIPDKWLEKRLELELTEDEKAAIEAMGGLDALRERFQQLLQEQKERHQGGNKWIGTGGRSPFGAYGYNPAGYRIGQDRGRHGSAVKVWDKREFANLRTDVDLDTRNMKMALRQLRVFTREGVPDELDLDLTIKNTSKNAGLLRLEMVPAKENRVKVLLLLDAGGSMDPYIDLCSKLFSSARHEFQHLEHYYFHNCVYEYMWKDNRRRYDERIMTWDILNKYNSDYKVIFVGDASMSPTEILYEGGAIEHHNQEAGILWLQRLKNHFPGMVWLNPEPVWGYTHSIGMIREFMEDKMYPLTVEGIGEAMRELKKRK